MDKKTKLTVLLGASVLALSAHAEFIENSQPRMQNYPHAMSKNANSGKYTAAQGGVQQIGGASGPQPYVRGFARQVSLLTALKQIVPTGWHAKRMGNLDVQIPVSWQGQNREWTAVLNQMGQEYGFVATINWNSKELTVEPVQVGSSTKMIAEMVNPGEWVLRPELTLRENVIEWGKMVGWEVSWGAVDYPVTSTVVFKGGDIDAENGPLHQLVEAYKNAEQPLVVSFWTNRVIRIENAVYQQSPSKDEMPNHRALR